MARPVVIGAAAVVVALGLGIAVGAVFVGGGDETVPSISSTTTSTATAGGVSPTTTSRDDLEGDALALAQAIDRAAGLTYHVVFTGSTLPRDDGQPGAQLTVEVWRRPPDARRDTLLSAPGGELQSVELLVDDELIGCFRLQSGQPYQCRPNPDAEADPSAPLFGTVDPAAGPVTVRAAEVAGVAARCFTVTPVSGAAQEACFDRDGIPVVIDGGDGRLERTAVDRDVPDDVFVPPS